MLTIVGVVLIVLGLAIAGCVVHRLPDESATLRAIFYSETPVENRMREEIAQRKRKRNNLLGVAVVLVIAGMILPIISAGL